jgi:hypothetical protein
LKNKSLFLLCCFTLFMGFGFWLAPEAFSAPGVTIAPASDSVYAVQGTDFSDASGMDITIRYDPTALAGPQVVQGGLIGGALMAINASTPGMIRLALVRVTAINGSGPIATITFTRLKSTGADILSLVSSAINSAGRNVPVTSQVVNSVKTADSGASTDQNAGQPTGGTSSSPEPGTPGTTATAPTGVVGMVVPVPGAPASDVQSANSSTGQPAADLQQPAADAIVPNEAAKDSSEKMIAKAVEPERKKIEMYQGVLERFKDFKGKKTPKALMALFNMQGKDANQDPPIVLSNGKATVKIVLELDSRGKNNNFLLDGASLVSLKNKEKDLWVLELLPDSRIYEATVSVPRGAQWNVIPLTVAPPMDVNIDPAAGRLTEADFKLYLKEQGTAKAPRFDLNKDGRRDYIDDFIFTANYLVQRDSPAKQGMPARK